MNRGLPASGCNHGKTGLLQNENEIKCILSLLELFHLVYILQNIMCQKIVEYKILAQILGKSI